jgi:hypothetical protein
VSHKGATLRFRYPGSIAVAAVIAGIAALPMLGASLWFAAILLIPLLLAVWAWRAGTDVNNDGLRVRAAVSSRTVPWAEVSELAPGPGGAVFVRLTSGGVLRLPAVRPADLPRLVAASGATLAGRDQ